MSRTQQSGSLRQAAPNLSIDAEAISNLRELLNQRRKLEDAVNAAPAEINSSEAELSSLRQQMASVEADIVLADDGHVPAMQKQINALSKAIAEKDFAVHRAKARLEALEARAPELDDKIEVAIGFVRIEAGIAAQSVRADIAEELRNKLFDLRLIYAKVRALSAIALDNRTRDFLESAVIPDLDHCMRITTITGTYEASVNLLSLKDDDTAAAESLISKSMGPITEVLALARKYRPYVPLAKRPAPYVRKGTWDGPGGRTERPATPEEADASAPRMKTIEEAMAEPYTIKGDANGVRTWKQTPVDMNISGAAMADAHTENL